LPKSHPIQLDTQSFFAFSRPGIVKANAFYELAIASVAGIRYYHIEKRAFLGTAARQSNNDHVCAYEVRNRKGCDFTANFTLLASIKWLMQVTSPLAGAPVVVHEIPEVTCAGSLAEKHKTRIDRSQGSGVVETTTD
jgi:hypothetical protein